MLGLGLFLLPKQINIEEETGFLLSIEAPDRLLKSGF
jgi:hypothetical protein